MIEFRHDLRLTMNAVDSPFTSGGQLLSECYCLATPIPQHRQQLRRPVHPRLARTSVLSSFVRSLTWRVSRKSASARLSLSSSPGDAWRTDGKSALKNGP